VMRPLLRGCRPNPSGRTNSQWPVAHWIYQRTARSYLPMLCGSRLFA
tara:strand:- start:97314 stop:97454 length:141 start_codon:yes stop_codon:yes gene_type:complete